MKITMIVSVLFITQLAIAGAVAKVRPSKAVLPAKMQAIITQKLGTPWAKYIESIANDGASGMVIGIDLGTTNSAVSFFEDGEIKTVLSKNGKESTPSVVSFKEDGEVVVGEAAVNQMVMSPASTIFSAKRFIGKKLQDVSNVNVPYEVISDAQGHAVFKINGEQVGPHEVSAIVLRHLKEIAELEIGKKITNAVITVPAYFGDSEKEATKLAGSIAGLTVSRLITEPTAAALAYKVQNDVDKKIVTYDLGGGTFDVTVLEITSENIEGVDEKTFEVVGTGGDVNLGGDNFDELLTRWILERIPEDVSDNLQALNMIRNEARRAKEALSSTDSYDLNIPFLPPTGAQVNETIMREDFDKLIEGFVDKTRRITIDLLDDIDVSIDEVSDVLLVGGSTRIPAVREMLQELFGKAPNHSVNPDKAVSQGAALQASNLSGELSAGGGGELLLIDVNPLALGIETHGGVFTEIIEAQEAIPVTRTQIFTTTEDNQTSVDVKVLQGGRVRVEDNNLIGNFVLSGIPMAKRGKPQIEVTFNVDANGILSVSAKDLGSGNEQKIIVESSKYKMDESEIAKMREKIEEYKELDNKTRQAIKAKEEVSRFVIEGKRLVDEQGEKISSTLKEELTTTVAQAERAIASDDQERIKKVRDSLEKKIHEVAEKITSSSSSSDSSSSSNSSDTKK